MVSKFGQKPVRKKSLHLWISRRMHRLNGSDLFLAFAKISLFFLSFSSGAQRSSRWSPCCKVWHSTSSAKRAGICYLNPDPYKPRDHGIMVGKNKLTSNQTFISFFRNFTQNYAKIQQCYGVSCN